MTQQSYYLEGGRRTPMQNPEAFKKEGWVSWGLRLVGAGPAKKKPEVRLHADGNPLHWGRVHYAQPHLSSSTASPAPQQQPSSPALLTRHQAPIISGTGFFNQPTMSNTTGNTNLYYPQRPLQERHSSSSSTGIPAPQQQHGQPSAAHQTPTSSGIGFFNQPSTSNRTGNTNMSWKDYRY